MKMSNPIKICFALTIAALLALAVGLFRGDFGSKQADIQKEASMLPAAMDAASPDSLAVRSSQQDTPELDTSLDAAPGTWTGGRPPLRYALRSDEGALVARIEKLGDSRRADEFSPRDDDYDFPSIEVNETGEVSMRIPDAPLPSRSSKRALNRGDGPPVKDGDLVALRYDVYSWSTGELIESHWHGGEEGLGYVLGGDNAAALPSYLERALRGRTLGSRVQVILHQGTEDLPDSFDPHDAYIVMIDIDSPEPEHVDAYVAAEEY